jgi:prevent-host-death family protein
MGNKTKKWQIQEAKSKFSEVVRRASVDGPQMVTKNGKDFAVILSAEDYRKLDFPKTSLVDFFQQSPLVDLNVDIKRDKSAMRDIKL